MVLKTNLLLHWVTAHLIQGLAQLIIYVLSQRDFPIDGKNIWETNSTWYDHVKEAKERKLKCGVKGQNIAKAPVHKILLRVLPIRYVNVPPILETVIITGVQAVGTLCTIQKQKSVASLVALKLQ